MSEAEQKERQGHKQTEGFHRGCKATSVYTVYSVFSIFLRGKSILFPLQIIHSAAEGDREGVLQKSIEMRFLTGYESKVSVAAASIQVNFIKKNKQ